MRTLKIETFDSASRLTKFVNDFNDNKLVEIEIVEIVGRRIADICNVYDLFYWEKPRSKKKK